MKPEDIVIQVRFYAFYTDEYKKEMPTDEQKAIIEAFVEDDSFQGELTRKSIIMTLKHR